MVDVINSSEIDSLASLVEETARATSSNGVKRFIEPAHGTLRRALTRRHHLVFGRRGSGKTSLLHKAAANLAGDGRPVIYVDLELYKANYYPDVLISVLIEVLNGFQGWLILKTKAKARMGLLSRLFGQRKSNQNPDQVSTTQLSKRIESIVTELRKQLHLADGIELEKRSHQLNEQSQQVDVQGRLQAASIAEASSAVTELGKETTGQEIIEKYTDSKIDFLHRRITEYQSVFRNLGKVSQGDSFLFFDDLYLIRKQDQAQLLDYFHRIVKGTNTWLKIGTIKQRSQLYLNSDPPMGIKIGDDAEEINLDLTLESYVLTKQFLVAILDGFIKEVSAPTISKFMADGAIDRLVLASGGVARDFLAIFRRSIDATRERIQVNPHKDRGKKIGAEDVNIAVGKYGEVKLQEFERDSLEDKGKLEAAYQKLIDFCINKAKANCFLLDITARGSEVELIEELVDLRLLHLVKGRVTVKSKRVGKIYRAFMLDLSQYAGARVRRHLKLVKLSGREAGKDLRRVSLIYM